MAGDDAGELIDVIDALREAADALRLPLLTPGQPEGTRVRAQLLAQLDDYVLPRLRSLEAPLLAVVGGSTGAGKSTLVNSIVGAPVTRSGVIRPTTTSPVLVHHPLEAHLFTDQRILPRLARRTGSIGQDQPGTVRLVPSDTLPAGIALLDAPDIDSVVQANRELATQLLAAADLWLFVTTAARYADAVPWDLLRTAAERGTALAIVLDRVPPGAVEEIRTHLVEMLREQGLGVAPVFTIPESTLTGDGLLPVDVTGRLRAWLEALGNDAIAREIVVSQTLRGAVASLTGRTQELVRASREQTTAGLALTTASHEEFERALHEVRGGMRDGSLLRGEVLARWQEFVGTGEFFRTVESTVGRWRDRVVAALKGSAPPARHLDEALHSGVATLVLAHGQSAAARTLREWRRLPGGAELIESHPELSVADPGVGADVDRLVRDWQGEIFEMVRTEGGNRRTNARVAAYGVNGIGLFLMLVAFAHTGGITGAEAGIAGGTAVLAQRVLEAIFGDQAVRDMAAKARHRLLTRVELLYATQRERFDTVVPDRGSAQEQSVALEDAAQALAGVIR